MAMTVQDRLPPGKYKLRIEDYLRLDGAGAFGDARTELLEGDVFLMSPMHRPHARVSSALFLAVDSGLKRAGIDLTPLVGASVAIPPSNVPEPDIVVTSNPEGDGLVPLASVRLVIEVSDSTIASDLQFKHRVYAEAGVPEYWVADVNARVIHQMWAPDGEGYAERRQVQFGEFVAAATIEGLMVGTAGV
ncbi:MAG: Uma2 family endonuclease [Sphingomonas sp.]